MTCFKERLAIYFVRVLSYIELLGRKNVKNRYY